MKSKLVLKCFSVLLVLIFAGTMIPSVPAGKINAATGIYSEIVGNLRIQILSPTLIRAEVKGEKGFEDRETFHIVNRADWSGDTVTKTEDAESVYLTTSTSKVAVKKDSTDLYGIKITDLRGNLIWKFTGLPSNKLSLPEANEDIYSFAIADTPRVVPAEWGFNKQPDTNTENIDTNGWDLDNDAADMYIFMPDNNHRQLRKDFVSLTGKTEMLPLSALGAWDSRYYAYSQKTAIEQIDGYHSRNLPLDVLVVDTDWRNAANGMGYDINTTLFPDMEKFLQDAHDRNVMIMFNDHPEPTQTNGIQNNVLASAEISYRSSSLDSILKLGVDGWWYDRNWATTVKPIDGFTHEVIGAAIYADSQKAVYPDRRLFMMSNLDGIRDGYVTNPANIAAHRYAVEWTGDTWGRQETILQEIYNAIEQGEINAIPYVSADLGAHQTRTNTLSNGEYLRWMQFGALSPIFRPHVMIDDIGRMPWVKGEEVTDIFRDYINLRYRLLPVFYQLSNENYETGMPMLRSMRFDYPNYKNADKYDQYMLGEDILVAPVIDGMIDTSTEAPVPADWLKNTEGPGIKAEYFNNMDLSGTPIVTKTESQVNFDWGNGSPDSLINSDKFSVRYTGTITVDGNSDIKLQLRSDDGCRMYIDGELVIDSWIPQETPLLYSSVVLENGKSYEIRIEYYEDGGGAICKLNYVKATLGNSRTVWIPEGEWIDTVSGETVYGPKTVSIDCEITDMPIYIKKGAVIPLADEMLTTKDKDWSHLTLDVYPSTRQTDSTILYEDDTESNAYQDGEYRTTLLETGFSSGKALLNIGSAEGSFQGERAFSERDWTVRVHRPEGFGELQSVNLNGTPISFTKILRDSEAMPLLTTGGATDGDVYEISFSSKIDEEQNLEFIFASVSEPEVPSDSYDVPFTRVLDNNLTDSPITKTISVTDDMPLNVNLTEEGTSDWYFASNGGNPIRKDIDIPKINVIFPQGSTMFYDYYTKFTAADAKNGMNFTNSTIGQHARELGTYYQINVTANSVPQELTLYIGGWNGKGRLEIFDESDNSVIETREFSSSGDKSIYNKVTIQFYSEKKSNLHIRYRLIERTNGNITITSATLKSLGTQINAEAENVISMINSLPLNISLEDENTVKSVRAAYDALDTEQKVFVTNINELINAEAVIEQLKSTSSLPNSSNTSSSPSQSSNLSSSSISNTSSNPTQSSNLNTSSISVSSDISSETQSSMVSESSASSVQSSEIILQSSDSTVSNASENVSNSNASNTASETGTESGTSSMSDGVSTEAASSKVLINPDTGDTGTGIFLSMVLLILSSACIFISVKLKKDDIL